MEIVIACWLGSIVISILIGNVAGIYYLNKLNEGWEETFAEVVKHIDG